MKVIHLPELPGRGRLGRHVEHDPQSRSFMCEPFDAAPLTSHSWERHCPPFNQGDLGSCTGNAMTGAAMTGPLFVPGRILTEDDAVKLYEAATRLDKIPGHYPPDDTGSSGLAVAKAAKKLGWIQNYRHAFGLNAALHALTRGPGILGINWYEGFDQPVGPGAELVIAGDVRGGHELEVLAIDVTLKLVRICNSWGEEYGDHGYVTMSFDTVEQLLDENGDFVEPRV